MTHDDATRLFYEHVWPHRAMVLRTARYLCRDAADADDLAQETLVKAFKSISQFDATAGTAKPWLSAITRNTWIDRHRTSHTAPLSIHDQEIDLADDRSLATPDVTDPAALLEQFADADLIKALRTLPEEIRWTLLLTDVEQLDQADAAQILDIPEGTVKSRAHRGRRMLRDYLTGKTGSRPSSHAEVRQ